MFKKIFKKSLKQISNKKIISDFAMRFQQKWFQRKSGGLIILWKSFAEIQQLFWDRYQNNDAVF